MLEAKGVLLLFTRGAILFTEPWISQKHHTDQIRMTSSNGNIFGVTGPLWGGSTDHRCIPLTNASDAELWCFISLNKRLSKQLRGRWFEIPQRSLWHHYNISMHQTVPPVLAIGSVGSIRAFVGLTSPVLHQAITRTNAGSLSIGSTKYTSTRFESNYKRKVLMSNTFDMLSAKWKWT